MTHAWSDLKRQRRARGAFLRSFPPVLPFDWHCMAMGVQWALHHDVVYGAAAHVENQLRAIAARRLYGAQP